MGLTILSALAVSFSRAKLLDIFMKCENVMLFKLCTLFLKIYVFELATFFLAWHYFNQLNLCSAYFYLQDLYFYEAFLFLTTVAIITEKVSYSCFHGNHY